VPTSFNLYRGVQFLLHFRLNRITLRRQYHALASPLAHLRRLLFPCPSDIKPIPCLSEAEIAELPLVNENVREDAQQIQTVVSILQLPKESYLERLMLISAIYKLDTQAGNTLVVIFSHF
jgi:hypothetical protein